MGVNRKERTENAPFHEPGSAGILAGVSVRTQFAGRMPALPTARRFMGREQVRTEQGPLSMNLPSAECGMRGAELGQLSSLLVLVLVPRPRRFMGREQVRTEHETLHEPIPGTPSAVGRTSPLARFWREGLDLPSRGAGALKRDRLAGVIISLADRTRRCLPLASCCKARWRQAGRSRFSGRWIVAAPLLFQSR